MLSIKFTVDGFDDDGTSPTFTYGRISGAIGPYAEGEPRHLVAGRLMRPRATPPMSPRGANFAPFRLDGNHLFVDLANSLPTVSVGGPLQDVGALSLALLPADGEPIALGGSEYLRPGFYADQAGTGLIAKGTLRRHDAAARGRRRHAGPRGRVLLPPRPARPRDDHAPRHPLRSTGGRSADRPDRGQPPRWRASRSRASARTMGPPFRDPSPVPETDPIRRTRPITMKGQPAPH